MKKAIFTFVFTLVTLITFTQSSNTVSYQTGTHSGTVKHQDTLFTDSDVTFNVSDANFTNYYQMDETFTSVIFSSTDPSVIQTINIDDTIYVRMSNPSMSNDYIKIVIIYSTEYGIASISESSLTRDQLKVFPSPATSDLKITFSTEDPKTVINVFSLNGQLIYQNTDSKVPGMNTIQLNVSNWSSGIYLVNDGKETFKFVKL